MISHMDSASAGTFCPCEPSNSRSDRLQQKSWGYRLDGGSTGKLLEAKSGEVLVTCAQESSTKGNNSTKEFCKITITIADIVTTQCEGLEWIANAEAYVSFQGNQTAFGVETTVWVKPQAFKCRNSKQITISYDSIKEEKDDTHLYLENQIISEAKLTKKGLRGSTAVLTRWRKFLITVKVRSSREGVEITKVFEFNTFEWRCDPEDPTSPSILNGQLCNEVSDCPSNATSVGSDEDPKICNVSQLPKKLSYLLYVYMVAILLAYFLGLRSVKGRLVPKQSIKMDPNEQLPSKEKRDFKTKYKNAHRKGKGMEEYVRNVQYQIYQSSSSVSNKMCQWVREAEEELHGNPRPAYHCILNYYGGSHPITARIIDPSGGLFKIFLKKTKALLTMTNIRIFFMFLMLCLHMFDYVKDIGKTMNQGLKKSFS